MRHVKNFISALALSAVFALSGCSAPTSEVPTVQPTIESVQPETEPANVPAATPAPANMEDAREKAFVTVIRARFDAPGSDAEIIEMGRTICEGFDDFGVAGTIGIMLQGEPAPDPETLGFFMGASASAFCPEYMDDLRNLG